MSNQIFFKAKLLAASCLIDTTLYNEESFSDFRAISKLRYQSLYCGFTERSWYAILNLSYLFIEIDWTHLKFVQLFW